SSSACCWMFRLTSRSSRAISVASATRASELPRLRLPALPRWRLEPSIIPIMSHPTHLPRDCANVLYTTRRIQHNGGGDMSRLAVIGANEERLGPLVQFGLLAGPFLSMVDSNVVNVAIPQITRSFGDPLSEVQWAISGYLLAMASGLAA